MAEDNQNHNGITPTFKTEEYVWIRKQVRLDLMAMDEEIIEISTLVQQAGEVTCIAIEMRESTKNELDRLYSQSAEALRNSPVPAGQRRSETAIASQIYLNPKIEEKQKELSECRLNAALWGNLTESLKSKNFAIRVAADLINSGYLSSNTIMEKRRKEIRELKT